jgi:hypothetical protein
MRTDTCTKMVLTLIAISLVVLAGEKLTSTTSAVHANPGYQKWEYKTAIFRYTWTGDGNVAGADCVVDNASAPCAGLIAQLGGDGWELVSVVPESRKTGPTWAGVTTQQSWVFKRPRN